jgi:two-component system, OmpR family, sensor histidine kinase CpxA
MRSLFLKIFLSFWLTQAILIGVALVLAEHAPQTVVTRWRALASDALKLYNNTAVGYLEGGHSPSAAAYLGNAERSADMRLFWFDGSARQIFGAKSPEKIRRMAETTLRAGQPQFESGLETNLATQLSFGQEHKPYVLVAVVSHGHGPLAFRRSVREIIWRLLLATIVSGFVCFGLARYLARPILRLRETAQQLARGDLTARAEETGRQDEIADLVYDFNRMAERLQALMESQKQLISDLSHELRSPLARLNVALALARQRAQTHQEGVLDRIELEATRLNEMIEKMLTIAKLETGDQQPQAEINLAELLREVAADANFEARSRDCRVVLDVDECRVMGNSGLLRSALENVVRNAVRYTGEGSEVQVKLACPNPSASDRLAVITVRDHGPGVPEQELDNLFRPFYRLDTARTRDTGGSGLGLAIAERAVRLHGGAISASNVQGGGFIVEMRLPATAGSRTEATPGSRARVDLPA